MAIDTATARTKADDASTVRRGKTKVYAIRRVGASDVQHLKLVRVWSTAASSREDALLLYARWRHWSLDSVRWGVERYDQKSFPYLEHNGHRFYAERKPAAG